MKKLPTIVFMVSLLLPMWSLAVDASVLENLTVMALGPLDGRAVVKMPDGKMQVLKLGDTVPNTKAVVRQVLTDKLVVSDPIEKDGKTVGTQTVWILKPTKAGEKSQVQRLDREGPAPTPILKPAAGTGKGEVKKK